MADAAKDMASAGGWISLPPFRDSLAWGVPVRGSGMLKDLDITPDDPAALRAVNQLLADEVRALSL